MSGDPLRRKLVAGDRPPAVQRGEKLALVWATMQPGMVGSAVALINGLPPSLLSKRVQMMSKEGWITVKAYEDVVAASKADLSP